MNKSTLGIVVVIAIAVAAGAWWYMSQPKAAQPTAGIANPASQNCVTLGGTLEIAEDSTGGAIGICHMPDGSSCEEWALFRGEGCVNPNAAPATSTATTTR